MINRIDYSEIASPVLAALSSITQAENLDNTQFQRAYNLYVLLNYYPLMSEKQLELVLEDCGSFVEELVASKKELSELLWNSLELYRERF